MLIDKSYRKIQFVVLSDGIAYGPYLPSAICSPKTYFVAGEITNMMTQS